MSIRCSCSLLILASLTLTPVASADDWPAFRGVERDGISKESGLLKEWPEGGPTKAWTSSDAGIGYSSFAVVGNRLYTMGADDDNEYIIALDAANGKKVWQASVGKRLTNRWGDGSRSTPAVSGNFVIGLGATGGLYCVNATDGSLKWSVEMKDLGGKAPNWGYSESPLVDGDTVLCTPGGDAGTVAAFQLQSGEKLWQSDEIKANAHYSSIVPVDHFGKRQYIQLTQNKVFGLDTDGKLKWQADWPKGKTAVIPTPIYDNGNVYVTSGYSAGCMLINVDASNNVTQVYDNLLMQNHHGGVIKFGDHIYGNTKGRGWICQDMQSGEVVWFEKSKLKKGAIAFADGMFYCLDETNGTCALIEASNEGWNERGRLVIEPQTKQRSARGKIWSHPVIANGKLYLRDQEIVCCYNIKG